MACLLSSRGWIGTWSLMPVYALNLSSGLTSGEDLMKSARRSGRITGSRVHQHTMALKLETQGGRGERGGQALCSLQGWCHLPSRGHFVPCTSSRHEGSWTAGTQASLQPGLPLSEGPWAACHPPG